MIGLSLQDIVEKIKTSKHLTEEDIKLKIKEKKSALGGLVSDEGAAHIVANELGIDVMAEVRQRGVKINRLQQGMRVGVVGKILKTYDVKTYERNGRKGKVGSFLIGDETGMLRIVLWDDNHLLKMEDHTITQDKTIKITNGNVRVNNGYKEMHLGNYSTLEINPEGISVQPVLNAPSSQFTYTKKKINEIQDGETATLFGTIVQIFEPRFYDGCSECYKKITNGACSQHAHATPTKVPILNIYLDDGFGGIRATAFRDQATSLLGVTSEDLLALQSNADKFNELKNTVLGKQLHISGKATLNAMSNRLEFSIRNVHPTNPEDLLKHTSF